MPFLRGGGGGGGLQRNEHMTFIVDIIDMWGFPKLFELWSSKFSSFDLHGTTLIQLQPKMAEVSECQVDAHAVQKVFNLPSCKISSFQIFLKIMRVKAFKLQNIWIILFKIGFLFPVPADLALICWLKVETFLNDLTYRKPSSRVVPAYPQLFCNSAPVLALSKRLIVNSL